MLTVNFISKIFDLDKNRERRRKKKMKDTIDSFQSCWAGKFQFSRLVWNGGHDGPSIPYWKLSTWPSINKEETVPALIRTTNTLIAARDTIHGSQNTRPDHPSSIVLPWTDHARSNQSKWIGRIPRQILLLLLHAKLYLIEIIEHVEKHFW